MDIPFETYVDGQKIERWHVYTEGKNLVARVLPKNEWPEKFRKELTELIHQDGLTRSIEKFDKPIPVLEEPVHLYLLTTPISEYKDLEKHIDAMENKKVNMGEIPTLKEYRQSEIKTELEPGFFYDLLATGIHKGNRVMAGGGRLSTVKGEVPYFMTLDELKLFAIENLELTQKQAEKIKAKITPMTAWGNRGRFIIAGFEFGNGYGIRVTHMGGVSYYRRYSKEEIREALRV